ncbi:MAG: type II toxin-antitoxin system RelE/ParE family toxin [bacterium]
MIKDKEYIVYQGSEYIIEWYFDQKGISESFNYYQKLDKARRIQLLKLVKRLGDIGKIYNKELFRYEGEKIFAFKPKPDRYLCFFYRGKKVIITNAFTKKSQKIPMEEKAIKAMNDYQRRVEEGGYYG